MRFGIITAIAFISACGPPRDRPLVVKLLPATTASVQPGMITGPQADMVCPMLICTNIKYFDPTTLTCGCGGGCISNADCDDFDPCTSDTCSAGVCSHGNAPNNTSCGTVCTTGGRCSSGVCSGGTPIANGTACDDANACTYNDACSAGACTGTAYSCTGSTC